MKVLFVPDVVDWAIGHLVASKVKHLPQFECTVRAVHPRDASQEAESFFQEVEAINPDVIIYEYFRSAEQLITAKPELKRYKSILVHHNQRDKALFHADWNALGIDTLVTHTNKAREKLNDRGYFNVETINHGIDLDFFKFNDIEPEEPMVGYVGRIVPWKGLKEIAQACKELNYQCQVMGKQDKPDYWNEIPKDNLRFDFFDCGDAERVNAYHNMTVYVGNSEDNYEEGTLPYLEAMACGVPVITTPNGVANDIAQNEYNALVVPFGDYEALKSAIDQLMKDKELRDRLRVNAWNTVKNMPEQKMAWEYGRLIHKVAHKDDLVSVIIPSTLDRSNQVDNILYALENQSYNHQAIEAIVVFDELATEENFEKVRQMKYKGRLTHRILFTDKEGYNLAMARNLGAIEADGKYLLFCDSRLKPERDSIATFIKATAEFNQGELYWLFGDKGANKSAFVENFSFIKRKSFFTFGMMNERITKYGGMSQELRTRFIQQGGEFSYVKDAKSMEMMKSGTSDKKRKEIIESKFQLLKMYEGDSH